jgi:DNA repair protein RadC
MPADVASFWKAQIINHSSFKEDREACYTLHLNAKNRLITWTTNTVGGIDSTIVNPGVVFREAIAVAARAIVLLHNHPSGDPTPSAEDLRITKQLIECGKILDINLMDHVILINSGDRHLSMRESGVMSFTS